MEPHKTIHINPDAIDAVEAYRDEEGEVISLKVFTQGKDIDPETGQLEPLMFTTSSKQEYVPAILDGLIILRGAPKE